VRHLHAVLHAGVVAVGVAQLHRTRDAAQRTTTRVRPTLVGDVLQTEAIGPGGVGGHAGCEQRRRKAREVRGHRRGLSVSRLCVGREVGRTATTVPEGANIPVITIRPQQAVTQVVVGVAHLG